MEAASRDDVFAALRARKIRPIKVVAADGSKANGEMRGVRRRVVAVGAAVLVVAAAGIGVLAFRAGESQHQPTRQLANAQVAEIEAARHEPVGIAASDSREVRELKQMVNGLHEELNAYLANGNGTIRSYARRLLERTREEAQIYERTKRELERETNSVAWERKNDSLRNLGLPPVTNPKEGD